MTRREIVERFIKGSSGFMEAAIERSNAVDYDLACFMAEQAVQLYLKSVIPEKTGEVLRTHSIRQLLSIVSELSDVKLNLDRRSLIFLEDAEDTIKIPKEVMSAVSRAVEGEN